MIRTGDEYRASIRDGREVYINGERVKDVPSHPAFKPIVDARARIYDMAHEDRYRDTMTVEAPDGERCSVSWQPPRSKADLRAKRAWVDAVMEDIEGVAFRLGDETIGAVWSLLDGKDVLDTVTSDYTANIERHVERFADEGLDDFRFETDHGVPWQGRLGPDLMRAGFFPRVVLPHGGLGDVIVWERDWLPG